MFLLGLKLGKSENAKDLTAVVINLNLQYYVSAIFFTSHNTRSLERIQVVLSSFIVFAKNSFCQSHGFVNLNSIHLPCKMMVNHV